MKNTEKYPETKSALKAWNEYRDGGGDMPFVVWAEQEQEAAVPTLLWAASMFVNCAETPSDPRERRRWDELCAAIRRERAKPVRNCDKYRTAKKAYAAFEEACRKEACLGCRLSIPGVPCVVAWFYDGDEKEGTK